MKKVATVGEVNPILCVSVGFKQLALFKVQGKIYCINNRCTHLLGPLCKGKLSKGVVTCPWHGSKFDVRTGKVKGGPAKKDIGYYRVVVKDGEVYVDL